MAAFASGTEIPKFTTAWTVPADKQKKKIFLFADDRSLIERVMKVLADYTKRVDPAAAVKFHPIKINKDPKLVQTLQETAIRERTIAKGGVVDAREFTFKVKIHRVIPRIVRQNYGYPDVNTNCHGMALVGAGILPVPLHLNSPLPELLAPFTPPIPEGRYNLVPEDDISAGDLVYFRKEDHSIVYLDKEFCLSTCGINQPFLLHGLNEVQKLYECSLYGNTTVLRKGESSQAIEDILPLILAPGSEEALTRHALAVLGDLEVSVWDKFLVDFINTTLRERVITPRHRKDDYHQASLLFRESIKPRRRDSASVFLTGPGSDSIPKKSSSATCSLQ